MRSNILKMELHKIEREIRVHGKEYTFLRKKTDEYGEPTDEEPEQVAVVCGLFHITKGYVSKSVQDATITHSKGQPMLLVCYSDADDILPGDYFIENGNTYKVVGKNNVQEYSIVADFSLEVVLDGRN